MEPMSGSPMEALHRKLKRLKQRLKAFNKEMFSDLSMRVKAKRVELDRVQEEVLRQPRVDLVQSEKKLSKELYELMQAEEEFYKQKSRIRWLREGDANTNFFHKSIAIRQNKGTISTLTDSDGNKILTHLELAKKAVSYFQKLIGTADESVTGCSLSLLEELFGTSITSEANADLARSVTSDEIKSTMFGIDGDKAPGPDGFTAHFFKTS